MQQALPAIKSIVTHALAVRRKHLAQAIAKTDAPEAAALTMGTKNDGVTVLQKSTTFAVGKD